MAIFGVGAYYEEDVSQAFIQANLVGVGWDATDAPELHQFMRSLKVGDIVQEKIGTGTINTQLPGQYSDDRQARLPESGPLVQVARLRERAGKLWANVNDK